MIGSVWLALLLGFWLMLPQPGTAANKSAPPPSTPPALVQAKQLIEKNDPESAATALRRYLTTPPHPEYLDDTYLLLGAALYSMKDYPESIKYLNQLQSEFPESDLLERGKLLLARAHAAMGNPDLALPLLAQVRTGTQDDGTRHEALTLTADVLVQKKDFVRAIRILLESMQGALDEDTADAREQIREMIAVKLDLKGLIRRLDYIQGLGATAIWLGPIFKNKPVQGGPGQESAGYHGYWAEDFVQTDPHFGTLKELKRLVKMAHARGLKVILDFVPNHSSDRHPWFVESRASRENPKRDWYIWRDPGPDGGPRLHAVGRHDEACRRLMRMSAGVLTRPILVLSPE